MKVTDINYIKEITKLLLNVPVEQCQTQIPFILCHPFASTDSVYLMKEKRLAQLSNKEDEKIWKKEMTELIDKEETTLIKIYMILNKPYRLLWVKQCKSYMSDKDFAEFLSDAWVDSENPNQDTNVKIKDSIEMFKTASKKYLMTEDDYEIYNNIPNKITLYRGVSVGREKYGLSWTASKSKAEWFKNRFRSGGYLLEVEANKKDILAYFNTRNEDEYVLDVEKYKKKIKEIEF